MAAVPTGHGDASRRRRDDRRDPRAPAQRRRDPRRHTGTVRAGRAVGTWLAEQLRQLQPAFFELGRLALDGAELVCQSLQPLVVALVVRGELLVLVGDLP